MYECMMHGVLLSGQMTKSLDQPAKKGFEHVGSLSPLNDMSWPFTSGHLLGIPRKCLRFKKAQPYGPWAERLQLELRSTPQVP